MLRRYRWLLFAATVSAFAVGFVLSMATFGPAPAAPEATRPVVDEQPQCNDENGGFVGIHEGHVAIFHGTPGGCHQLVETHSITADRLPTFQVLDLERGITFSGEDELFQILEGLSAP